MAEGYLTLDEWEEMAEQFYRETGYLAPGKDWPAAMVGDPRGDDDVRREKWIEWRTQRSAKALHG
jgi:hypothetical protein